MSKPRNITDPQERGVFDLSKVVDAFSGKIKMHDTYIQVMVITLAQHMGVEAKHVVAAFIKEVCEKRVNKTLNMNGSPSPTYYPVFDKSQGLVFFFVSVIYVSHIFFCF